MVAVRAAVLGVMCALAMPALGQGMDPSPAELPRVLPVWSTDSGRVEALLLIDASDTSGFSHSPLDSLIGTPPEFGLRGRTRLNRNIGFNVDLRPSAPSMALLCEGNVGLAVGLGRFAEPCLLAQLDDNGRFASFGTRESLGVSLDWQDDAGALDLSFGLSWLNAGSAHASVTGFNFGGPGVNAAHVPLLDSLGAWQLRGQEFSVAGERWLTPRSWLRVDGRHGSNRLSGMFGEPLQWDNTSLSVSGGYRAFSGHITGRLVEIDHPRQVWSDVDIALSWRTPWDARVSVGARNLLGGPDREKWPLASLPGLPESESRTPYVRYQQDL
jgi:hypothetical protein